MGGVARKKRKGSDADIRRKASRLHGAPPKGWIRTLRQSRGISLRRLGERVGVAGNSVHDSEKREQEGGISLNQLHRFARALDCDLHYTFVSRKARR